MSIKDIIDNNLLSTEEIAKYFVNVSFQLDIIPSSQKKIAISVKPEHVNDSFSGFKYEEFLNEAFLHALRYVKDIKGNDNREYQDALVHFRSENNQGKVGELFLFIFLNHFFKSLRVGSKVEFCSPKEQVRGLDALHVCWDDQKNRPHFILGESKFYEYKDFAKATREALNSLSKYIDKQWKSELSQFYNHKSEEMSKLLEQIKQEDDYSLSTVVFIVQKDAKLEYHKNHATYREELEREIKEQLESSIQKIQGYNLTKQAKNLTKKPYENAQNFLNNPNLMAHVHFIIFPLPEMESFEEALSKKAGISLKNNIGKNQK